jgi:non-specific serine/threonine protein kinase
VQAIAFLAGLKEKIIRTGRKFRAEAKHLVVVPATLTFNWKQEFSRFYPDLSVQEYAGSGRRKNFDGADVILTTYDIIRQENDFFQKQHFHVIIFDEAQFLKNIYSQRTISARKLRADFMLTLTGTPLENHIGEYFSILDLSLPGLLGNYEDFRRRAREGSWERLKARAAPFVLRRTKEFALKELPAKTENEIYLRMTGRQRALYQKVVLKVRRSVRQAFQEKKPAQASLTALTAILRLRQVCVSPRLLDPKSHERSPKMEYLLTKLSELTAEDHSAIVFSQFTAFLDVLEEELQKEKLDYLRMDGSTPVFKRKLLIDAFQCGAGAPIFLVSLKTGGVGLNLTRASYVFHLDPWWNPAVENQASDRVHRIGQKKNVFVTRLLMQHTVEEKMVLLKKKKAALYRQVLGSGKPGNTGGGLLTHEDFNFLLHGEAEI